jgi:uncharacterized protein (UPF0335 family)
MANIGIDRNDVFVAAEAVLASGKEPTIKGIREKLGTGSLTTVSKYLKEWSANRLKQSPVATPPEEFAIASQQLWAMAYREAEKALQAQKNTLLLEQQKLEEENQTFSEEIEKLEAEKATQLLRIKELMETLEKEAAAVLQMRNTITDAREQRARLEGEVTALNARLKAESERGVRLEKEIAEIAKSNKSKS